MQDTLNILLPETSDSDYIEHHGVKGMHWGVRRMRKKALKQINKLEKKQYKLAKPYADKNGHFKITDPKKAAKHHEYSEKIVNLKKLVKQIDEGKKEVNKKYSGTSMDYIHQAHLQAHQIATQQQMNFMHQVQQQNTLQSIQNFHNQMHFDNMINMQNIHTHNMMF